jgi:hypothetical protein
MEARRAGTYIVNVVAPGRSTSAQIMKRWPAIIYYWIQPHIPFLMSIRFSCFLSAWLASTLMIAQPCVDGSGPCAGTASAPSNGQPVGVPKAMIGYTVERTIPAPTVNTGDIALDGDAIYIGDPGTNMVHRIDAFDGNVLDAIATSLPMVGGLAYDGTHLWVAESIPSGPGKVLKIDPATHVALDSFTVQNGSALHGMDHHDGELWLNVHHAGTIDTTVVLDLEGNVLQRRANGQLFSHGLCFRGDEPWIAMNAISAPEPYALILRYDAITFLPVDTMLVPGGNYPNGIAWDGDALWVAESGTDLLYLLAPDASIGLSPDLIAPATAVRYANGAVSVTAAGTDELRILDLGGRLVLQTSLRNGPSIAVDHLPCGVYVAHGFRNGAPVFAERVQVW